MASADLALVESFVVVMVKAHWRVEKRVVSIPQQQVAKKEPAMVSWVAQACSQAFSEGVAEVWEQVA